MEHDAGRLIEAARAAAAHAHAPYSRFAVGAALLLSDGDLMTGANFENASYGLSLCAETVAVASASAAGRLGDVVAVGVVGGAMDAGGRPRGDAPVRPCGRCRQVLNEAAQMGGRDLLIHCAGAEGNAVASYRLSDLLPDAFGPADLGHGRAKAPAPGPPLARSAPVPTERDMDQERMMDSRTDDAGATGAGARKPAAGDGGIIGGSGAVPSPMGAAEMQNDTGMGDGAEKPEDDPVLMSGGEAPDGA